MCVNKVMPIPRTLPIEQLQDNLVPGGEWAYRIIMCKQKIVRMDRYHEDNSCYAEFTSSRFELHTCLIWPRFNVPMDKVINLKAGNLRHVINSANTDKINNYDYVYCAKCDLHCGVIYENTVALVLFDAYKDMGHYILDGLMHPNMLPAVSVPYRHFNTAAFRGNNWQRFVDTRFAIADSDALYFVKNASTRETLMSCRKRTSQVLYEGLKPLACLCEERECKDKVDIKYRYSDMIWVSAVIANFLYPTVFSQSLSSS